MRKKNSEARDSGSQLQVVSDGQYVITGDLDFQSVPRVLKSSLALFSRGSPLTIDLASVNHSNSAGLALLVEWMRFAKTSGCTIKFLNLPDQMREIAQLCGVDKKLPV